MNIKVNVAYDRTLAALSHVKEAADVLAQVIINQGVHSPSFEAKLKPSDFPGIPAADARVLASVKPVEEVASIHDMADKLRAQNSGLIEELKKALFSVDKWRDVAKGFENDKNEEKRKADHWEETAKRYATDCEFYSDICNKIGNELGPQAYTADDGVRGDSVHVLKLVEMVSKLCREHGEARYELRRIGSRLLPFGCSLTDDGAIDIKSIDPTLAKALASGYWPFGTQCPKPTEPWAIPSQGPTEQVAMTTSGITDVPKLREALKIVVKERDEARDELKAIEEALKVVKKHRDSLTVSVRVQADNIKGCGEENKKVKRDLEQLKQDYGELTAAYHGVNLAHNDLQRRVANAKNQLDLEGQLNETPKTGEKPFYHGLR